MAMKKYDLHELLFLKKTRMYLYYPHKNGTNNVFNELLEIMRDRTDNIRGK